MLNHNQGVLVFIFLSVSFFNSLLGQDKPKLENGVLNPLKIEHSSTVIKGFEYYPEINRYIYSEKIGRFNLNPPKVMTPEEFSEYKMKTHIKSYFKNKSNAINGNKNTSEEEQRDLLPSFYVNSDFFGTLFGGNEIDFDPYGSVEIDLGIRYQSIDNPSIATINRTNTSFDFNTRTNLGIRANIGTRLRASANYDNQATFDFQNIFKIQYVPNFEKELNDNIDFEQDSPLNLEDTAIDFEDINAGSVIANIDKRLDVSDGIIKKLEFGNVSMPLSNSLLSGPQSLFGLYSELQFGKTRFKFAFADQRSKTKTVRASGGGSLEEFSFMALDYDDNRNYFLSHYFRDNYEKALENFPFINTQIQITRIEVWVTNRSRQTNNVRNILAIQDLGESKPKNTRIKNAVPDFFDSVTDLPRNEANGFNPNLIGSSSSYLEEQIRQIPTVQEGFGKISSLVNQGFDYSILENAQKLEEDVDYSLHEKLGYISLNQRLNNDEILGVAFQFTFRGEVYQVGEFASNSGIEATELDEETSLPKSNALVVKMLKSNLTQTTDPIWDLMMKNIYDSGAYELSEEDFILNVFYADPSPLNYLVPEDETSWPNGLDDRILLNVMNLDKLDANQFQISNGDGFFDFVEGVTVSSKRGKIIFPKLEPFGRFIHKVLGDGDYDNFTSYNPNQTKYVFREMYTETKAKALEYIDKNKYQIKGRYKTKRARGISLGAFNIPQGSVKVTLGGRKLIEGIDYTVNYQSGTLRIIDPSIESSNSPLDITLENNAIFNQQNKSFVGLNVEHKFNKNFQLGFTWMNLNEKPITQKVNYNMEPVDNSVYGLNGVVNFRLPSITRMVNLLPFVDTKVESKLSIKGEIAYLSPSAPQAANLNGEVTTYIEDFEGAQINNDIKSPISWSLASAPLNFGGEIEKNNLDYGSKRAKLAWYSIDPVFYSSQRPDDVTEEEISKNETRRIFINELFEQQDIAVGQNTVQTTLDLAYYPDSKGPYNNHKDFSSLDKTEKWAGIIRQTPINNLEQSNIEFIQFWVLDPFNQKATGDLDNDGVLYFDIGKISEDILKDGVKQFENGLPKSDGNDYSMTTSWGKVPSTQSLIYAFDTNTENRALQDVGLDGLNDDEESTVFYNNPIDDPALDNYEFYLEKEGGILERYLNYNNTQGNSPVGVTDTSRGSNGFPDVEDVDKDQTMNTIDSYYRYKIAIKPNASIDDPYVNDIKESEVTTPDGNIIRPRWIQYKIPLTDPSETYGGITDLRSVSHLRMFLNGFDNEVVLRFGTLDLVGKDWRTYTESLQRNNDNPDDDNTFFNVQTLNILENENRSPIPYKLPPGIVREQLNSNNTIVRQNEQALSLQFCDLESEDARAVFKRVDFDFRQYKQMKMFVHAESFKNNFVADNQIVAFIRIGTDYTRNYYQIELPLGLTPSGASTPEMIWPTDNNFDIDLEKLTKMKAIQISNPSNEAVYFDEDLNPIDEFAARDTGSKRYTIVGNPSLGNITALMLGIKNAVDTDICGEVWFNELRIAELSNAGGWATAAEVNLNLADFATISTSGKIASIGYGTIEQTPNQRSLDETKQFSILTSVNLEQLFPKSWGLSIPFSYNQSQILITPKYDPFYQDILLDDRISFADISERDKIREQSNDATNNYGFNFNRVRKIKNGNSKRHFFDIENFSLDYSYNNQIKNNYEIKSSFDKYSKSRVNYSYNFNRITLKPFQSLKGNIFSKSYMKWLRDFNINLLPNTITASTSITRRFQQKHLRQIKLGGVDESQLKKLPPLQQRNYFFDWNYNISYSIFRSLQLSLSASSNRIIRNYYQKDLNGDDLLDSNQDPIIDQDFGFWDDYWNIGEGNTYNHKLKVDYSLPFGKLPMLDFISSNYSYTADFQWKNGSNVLKKLAGHEINRVQNNGKHNLTAALNMNVLYEKIGISADENDSSVKQMVFNFLGMIKRVNVSYSILSGSVLPGFTRNISFLGTLEPSFLFAFGDQAHILNEASQKGYLTTFPDFNDLYIRKITNSLKYTVSIQPLSGLVIDLAGNQSYNNTYQEQFSVTKSSEDEYSYDSLSLNEYGSFSSSTMMIFTAFDPSSESSSDSFENFKSNRLEIANRLALEKGILIDQNTISNQTFPEGYSKNNPSVLIPSFISAYTGSSASNINLDPFSGFPFPGWNIKYTGLMNFKLFQKVFNRLSFNHSYKATLSLNSFKTNLDYDSSLPNKKDDNGDYINKYVFNNIILTERFSPLIGLDFELKNSFSFRIRVSKSRLLTLSLDNNLINEVLVNEYVFGLGYRIKNIKIKSNLFEKNSVYQGNINFKLDFNIKDDATYIRNLNLDTTQITTGSNNYSLKFTSDYSISKHFNVIFFYDHNYSDYKISTAFPRTTIRSGITLRVTF